MDNLRFEELKHTITYGGLPNVSKETFTHEQVSDIVGICKLRADESIAYAIALQQPQTGASTEDVKTEVETTEQLGAE